MWIFFALVYTSLFSEKVTNLPQDLLQQSLVNPIIYQGKYYSSASIPISISSTLGKNISLKEAELEATKLFYQKFCFPVWKISNDFLNYEKLILSECNRKNEYLVEGLKIFSKKIIKDKAVVTVSVPKSSLPSLSEREKEAIPHLAKLARTDQVFDVFLIYELDLLDNDSPGRSIALLKEKLSSVFNKNSMDVLFDEYPIEGIPLFYSSYDSQKWILKYKKFGRNEFLSAFEYGPFFNDLSYFAGKYFKSLGYFKMAELFFKRGSKFKFQPKYYDLCKVELGIEEALKDTTTKDCKNLYDIIIASNGELSIIDGKKINDNYLYGIKSFKAKDFDKSCDFFVKALGENFNSDTLNYLGRTLEELGNLNHAIIAFKQAVKIDPNHEYAETNLGFSLFKSGKLDEAMEIKAKLLSQNNVNSWCRKRLEEISIDTKTKTRKEDVTPNFLQFIE